MSLTHYFKISKDGRRAFIFRRRLFRRDVWVDELVQSGSYAPPGRSLAERARRAIDLLH